MAPANHIQAAASWLVTAAQPTKWYGQRQLRNDRWLRAGSEFLRCKFKFLLGVSEFSRAE